MSDKTTPLILDALGKALAAPDGLPLHAAKRTDGLFSGTSAAKAAAESAARNGLLRTLAHETNGKQVVELFGITEKGLSFLLDQTSPRLAVERLAAAVEAGESRMKNLGDSVRCLGESMATIRQAVERLATMAERVSVNGHAHVTNGSGTWWTAIDAHLRGWAESRHGADCPLPELFRIGSSVAPSLTIGQLHDELRKQHSASQIYLHPWTGPLYDMPEPSFALLIGHEVAYYASKR